ncbi:MAG: iron-sulfur cluster repair di-iron protein, ric [Holdemanella sp.]|nr:iron-sulfur cluster repair di-iron protein, ric [Holdemanella sp.]
MNNEIIKELDKILPVVERVHSDVHPELHEVAKLYTALKENPRSETFEKLRTVTSNFTAPDDACPTYKKAYAHLSTLEKDFL